MFKRLLVTAAPLLVAGAVPAALSLGGASAATMPSAGLPTSALAPVTNLLGSVTASLLPASHSAVVPHAITAPAGRAPVSHATGNGLKVNVLDTCVSCTSATAGSGSSMGESHALRLLGNDVSAGAATSDGADSGALLALPANPLLGLALADWMNQAQATGINSLAHARSALVDASIGNGQVATLAVLEGMSNAAYNGSMSHGDGATNGADLSLLNGGLAVILLHSESSSSGAQMVYVLSLNGSKVLATDQGTGSIPISIPGVIDIDLLQTAASGGLGSAALGTVADLLGNAGPVAGVLSTDSAGSAVAPAAAAPVTTAAVHHAIASASSGSSARALKAPMTGAAIGMAGFALLFSGISVAMAALGRRPRRRA
jgi:hypothetical protein